MFPCDITLHVLRRERRKTEQEHRRKHRSANTKQNLSIYSIVFSIIKLKIAYTLSFIFFFAVAGPRENEGITSMNSSGNILYEDRLVKLTKETLTVKRYYLPFSWPPLANKTVRWERLGHLYALPAHMKSGQFRIWGTGDFKIWFACDWKRPWRRKTFILDFPGRTQHIGFTVENEESFEKAINEIPVNLQTEAAEGSKHLIKKAKINVTLIMFGLLLLLALTVTGLSVPLIAEMVPPNGSYGFRTAKTLEHEATWYAANKFSGITFLVGGLINMVIAFVTYAKRHRWSSWAGILSCILVKIIG